MESSDATKEHSEQLHFPEADERALTVRAIVCGGLLGGVVTAMNLYLGLKIGWGIGGSLLAAILGFAIFSILSPTRPYTILEANITQTVGSAAGTMVPAAGLTATIPAMKMLGYDISTAGLFAWTLAVAYLGVMFAVPLRRQYVVVEKLRFPSGTATANTIVAMFAKAGDAVARAKVLMYVAVLAFCYIVLAHFIPDVEAPRLHLWLGSATIVTLSTWGFSLYLGPMLYGIGLLIGPRIGISMAVGAVLSWGILGYIAQQRGWAPHPDPMVIQEGGVWGASGWILWPGVALMVGDAMASLALSWRTLRDAFSGAGSALGDRSGRRADGRADRRGIPNSWWLTGLLVASLGTVLMTWAVFDIPPHLSIIAIALSAVLSNIAVRSTGETDINPVGPMGQVSQGAFGALTESMSTNIMAAGITGAGASQAADMMQDFKTGHLLGAAPRSQLFAQLYGVAIGVLCAVPLYLLFDHAWDIGDAESKLRAPSALTWKAVAEIMSQGFAALPTGASVAMLIALLVGASIPVVRKLFPRLEPYTPSGLALGIAFVVQPFYSMAILIGSLGLVVWRRRNREQSEQFIFPVACGLIAGQGLGGLVQAFFKLLDVPVWLV